MGSFVKISTIEQATATAGPGDVIALTVEDYNSNTQFWVYGQTGSYNADWERATLVSNASAGVNTAGLALEAVSIQMPGDLPANSVYLLYELNGSAYSQPYVINQPQIWWADTNNAYVGGKVSLFGTNLSYDFSQQPYGSDQSWAYLFPENSAGVVDGPPIPVTATAVPASSTGSGAVDVNPYKVDINLPADLEANTTYEVEVYNGHGGEYGLSNAFPITVAAAPTTVAYTLQAAYENYLNVAWASVYLNGGTSGLINPVAVNDAIIWAHNWTEYPPEDGHPDYVTINLPPGIVEVTAGSSCINLMQNVHLVGAGEGVGGTLIEAAPGANLYAVIQIPGSSVGDPSWSMQISNMSLAANGGLSTIYGPFNQAAVIYTDGNVYGLAIQDVTIDATTDNPADPSPPGGSVLDVEFSSASARLQFLDSTFIGPGIACSFNRSDADNCQFIGSGGTTLAQINATSGYDSDVTRCTLQSLVNNITSPGGNVEYDSAMSLFWGDAFNGNLYAGNNTTSDLYCVPEDGAGLGLNNGEVIQLEPFSDEPATGVAIYKNTFTGDGAESFLGNTAGVILQGAVDDVVADNDFGNMTSGIAVWTNNGPTEDQFNVFSDNSIHNVYIGISLSLGLSAVQNVPWFVGNVFSGNSINGIRVGAGNYYAPQPAAIYIVTYAAESNDPPQVLMNVFNGNTVTGASIGLYVGPNVDSLYPGQIGTVVMANSLFDTDGNVGLYDFCPSGQYSEASYWLVDQSGDAVSPILCLDNVLEGYWNT